MMGHSDNEKPCIKQNTDSMRQVKWIASRVAERRSSVAVFKPRMRDRSITGKQDLFELLAETVAQEVMICFFCGMRKSSGQRTQLSSSDVFKIIYLSDVTPACLLPPQWSFGSDGGSCPNTSGFIAPWSPPLPFPPPRWKRCCCLALRQWYWCYHALFSYLGCRGGVGSWVYLIKADWDFQRMHSRSRVLPGGAIIDATPWGQESHMGLSICRPSF